MIAADAGMRHFNADGQRGPISQIGIHVANGRGQRWLVSKCGRIPPALASQWHTKNYKLLITAGVGVGATMQL